MTLVKSVPTVAREHWKCVVKGEPEIDTNAFGAPIRTFDPQDGQGMEKMFPQG